jgi:hypothetical protein
MGTMGSSICSGSVISWSQRECFSEHSVLTPNTEYRRKHGKPDHLRLKVAPNIRPGMSTS